MDVLFKTIHGSHLYGLNHVDSDLDYFVVVDKMKTRRAKYATQEIVDGVDSVVVDFGTFVNGCVRGVPQYLEACFSEKAEVDRISAWRTGFRAGSDETWDRYLRTIKSFALQDDYKHKRHSLRLALNLLWLRDHGRFEPTLTTRQKAMLARWAEGTCEEVYDTALAIAWA